MTVRPATVNFTLYTYATFSEEQILRDSAGALINLTGCTALMHIRRDIADPLPLITLSTTDNSIILGGTAATIVLDISAADTAALYAELVDLAGETWYHDLLLTFPSGSVQRTYQGVLFVMPGVTRP